MKKSFFLMVLTFVSFVSMNAYGRAKLQYDDANYSFSYDSKLVVTEKGEGQLLVSPKSNPNGKTYLLIYGINVPFMEAITDSSSINIALRTACTSFLNKAKSSYAECNGTEPETLMHNGHPASVCTYVAKGSNGTTFYGKILYALAKSNMCGGSIQADNMEDYRLLCDVLSSLHFKEAPMASAVEDSPEDASGSGSAELNKTYRKGKFSFKHPDYMALTETEDEENGLQIAGVSSKGTAILNLTVLSNPLFSLLGKEDAEEILKPAIQEMGPTIKQMYTNAVIGEPMIDNSIRHPNVYLTFSGKLMGKSMQGVGRVLVIKDHYIVVIEQADSFSSMELLDAIYKTIQVE